MGGRGEMTKAPMRLQDLQRKRDGKAKAEPSWRFWGLDVHVCTMETLREAYGAAKANNGAPGIDGVTFEDREARGVEPFLEHLRDERVTRTYQPRRVRRQAIPKDGGTQVRVLGIPTRRDRGVQGALKVILEPIFEADCQPGS
jgi:RNA-directed DNA polymerase